MKKVVFLIFIICFMPAFSFAACTPPSQWGDGYEYSECAFQAQASLTSAVKNFWGNPKLAGGSILSASGSGIGNFILTKGVHCGTCGTKDDGTSTFVRNGESTLRYECPSGSSKKDDEGLLAYVATDVSEHGAEFCLVQFTATSWSSAFFVYHQLPRMSNNRNGLKCAWYCEPGWDGDRCMTRGISNTACEDVSYRVSYQNYIDLSINSLEDVQKNYANKNFCKHWTNSADKGNYCLAVSEGTDPAIGKTAVFDYKNIKSGDKYYQQQIVIGATEFMQHGIKAKPIWLGGNGTHHQCGDADNWTKIYAKEIGGKERVLCLRGYTLNENCDASSSACGTAVSYCPGWRAQDAIDALGVAYFEGKPEKYYARLSDNCKELRCRNGMNFSSSDNYACSVCKEEGGLQGLCPATNKCVWCGAGKCLNKEKCSCDTCSAVVSMEQMKTGPNKLDQCWSIIDREKFKACVTGIQPANEEEN